MPDGLTGKWWRPAAIVLAGSLAYLNSVSIPFLSDDMPSVVDNEQIRDIHHWGDLWSILIPGPNLPVSARPLVNLSFAINYAIGGLSVPGYHIWSASHPWRRPTRTTTSVAAASTSRRANGGTATHTVARRY